MRIGTLALAASLFLAAGGARADVVTWNTSSGWGSDQISNSGSSAGNTRTFQADSGEILKARAFYVTKSNGVADKNAPLRNATLQIYAEGLGVTSPGECACNPEHTTDNSGLNELIVFELPSSDWDPASVRLTPFGSSPDTDVTFLVGDNAALTSLASFEGKTLQWLLDNGFKTYDDTTSSSGARTVNVEGPTTTGRWLIVASWLNTKTTNDNFKIGAVAGKAPSTTQVAEPGSLALMVFGIGAMALYRRRALSSEA